VSKKRTLATGPCRRRRAHIAVPLSVPDRRDTLKWTDLHRETVFVQEWAQSHAMREFYASMMGIGLPLQSVPAGKQTVFSLVSAGFGVTLAQQSQAEASFPGVVFKRVDETKCAGRVLPGVVTPIRMRGDRPLPCLDA
jgi:hypothetical protein